MVSAALALAAATAMPRAGLAGEATRWLVFSGASVAETSLYFYTGARASLAGDIDASGFLIAGASATGLYRYAAPLAPGGVIEGRFSLYQFTAGYGHVAHDHGLTLLAGVRLTEHRLSAADPGNPVQGRKLGAVAAVDAWAKPWPDILVTASATAAQPFGNYWLRGSVGHRLPWSDATFAGIEVALAGDRTYREARLGIGVSGVRLGAARIDAAAGMTRSRERTGSYGWLGVWGKF